MRWDFSLYSAFFEDIGRYPSLLLHMSNKLYHLSFIFINCETRIFQALKQLLASSNNTHPTPILILLSGHKFDIDKVDSHGLIVVQKPLRASNIIPLLEANAQQLIDSGLCVKVVNEEGRGYRVLNQRGTQIFSSDDM